MVFIVPLIPKYGENFSVRKFESKEDERFKLFLLNSKPSDKFMIIEGDELKFRKNVSLTFETKEV